MSRWVACLSRFLLSLIMVAAIGWSQELPGKHIFPVHSDVPPPLGAAQTEGSVQSITYHYGPVMTGTVNIYLIWYGNWGGTTGANGTAVLQNLVSSLGGSPYFNITTTYYNPNGIALSNSVHFAGAIFDNYSQGAHLDDDAVNSIVGLAISSGQFPLDTNGVYFVLTSADVHEITGFCTQYCGWHNFATMSGANIKYAFVGNANQCLSACAEQTISSPNGDLGIDGMASTMAHELAEAVTDPNLNAWYDASGEEMADKCAWTFGTAYRTSNHSLANVNLGGLDYLLQQLWVNTSAGYCAMSYSRPGATLTMISPANGTPGSTVPVTLTGAGFPANSLVKVSGTGITVINPVVVSSTEITAEFVIAGNAAPGSYSVSVSTPSGNTLAQTFTVNSLTPSLTSLSPASGAPGTSVPVTLTGSNLVVPITLTISGSGVTATQVTVVSGTQIAANFNIALGATLGPRNVSVATANGTSGLVTFTVVQPAPTLLSINPSSTAAGTSILAILSGTNFVAPASLNIAGSGVTASGVTVSSGTQLSATLNVAANATAGGHNITVSTPGGTTGPVVFTVTGAVGGGSSAPALTSISPAAARRGATVQVTINGMNLSPNPVVVVSGDGVKVGQVSPVGAGGKVLSAILTIAANATQSTRTISVKTAAGTSNTLPFTIQ